MQNNSHSWLYNQLFLDWKKFEVIYCLGLITLQLLVYAIAPDSLVGMLSGVTGIMSLVYGMKGRRVAFIFGTIQCIAMTYIAWISHAYGSFSMDIIYVISQPIGWFMWGNDESVHQFSNKMRQLIFFGAFIAWLMGWFILSQVNGQLPYFDSINFVLSFIAQILYILKYRENWSLWIIVNLANLIYWSVLTIQILNGDTAIGTLGANLSQVALQAALLFNSIYATKVWAENSRK
ncbi:nicotinamide mononucleotide transporter [Enterococcus hirae]|uniref:nicotinamide riboside transporter PnuC n=1 Tax=Enterococcus TaxID=1350 RepID=UPI0009C01C5E|nr:nicotinamide riboside transporter PnuC [Enterococcus hirae]EMF0039935.1 nicotinamide mononucleotide transporter [Enterococcus hirae]EMF0066087.1 nicotinamide mononucleotide transporter [Enterococcus hirae]EMF0071016.1 nicotinamide mononucleotide transporter [Enterococcus hirae]EMF0079065.1 nicotinamide mononucleotide transporter [Enterococcus hirae]EMF0081427.1 nicotinamide mononucleotide transporter [Enterococcus hirae]